MVVVDLAAVPDVVRDETGRQEIVVEPVAPQAGGLLLVDEDDRSGGRVLGSAVAAGPTTRLPTIASAPIKSGVERLPKCFGHPRLGQVQDHTPLTCGIDVR